MMKARPRLAAGVLAVGVAACGGGGGGEPPPAGPAPEVIVPVDGPAWPAFGRDAQHTAVGAIATQPLARIAWSTPLDLAPQRTAGGALLIHYGSPVITRRNTVLMPVKTAAAGAYRAEARIGQTGVLVWSLASDYLLPPQRNWVPSFNLLLSADRLVMPAAGGRVIVRDDPDAPTGATRTLAFYGDAAYAASPAAFDASVFVNTPITADSQGNLYFGFSVAGANPAGLAGGIARLGADGTVGFVRASAAAGDATMVKAAMNSAPALSADERTLYAVVNSAAARPTGRLLALDAATLATRANRALVDPVTLTPAWVSDDSTASPTVGPDGDVYIGVLEANPPAHNLRGWLLHFDGTLATTRPPAAFGWDITPSIVPRAMVPAYAGPSAYLLAIKYNNYIGVGTGDGRNRLAIVDPNATQADAISGAAVMREVLTIDGVTPDPDGGVKEWCINTAAVDPASRSILVNSEDGTLYRWDLPSNTFSERITMNNGVAESYTPTAIAPDGRIYSVNNATLFSVGR